MTLLVQGTIPSLREAETRFHFRFNYSVGDIASITCNTQVLAQLIEYKLITRAELIEARKQNLCDTMVKRSRILGVRNGETPLAKAYDGTGVLLGIIDTGVDFKHPDLQDSLGKTRIKFLWDQVPVSGSAVPAPFNYGIEWTAAQIDANQCTHSDVPYYGHGTHVTGIAAGNGRANGKNRGIASKSDLIIVALDFNKVGPTISDAVKYIFDKATLLGKPCVINASVGDYYGSHDGTDLEAKLIDNMVKNIAGRALVAAAGNAGNIRFHAKTQPVGNDTLFTWLQNGTSTIEYWCYADTTQIKNLQMSVGANRLNYADLGRIGFKNYNYALGTVKSDTLKYNSKRIGIVKSSASINGSGVYELYLQIAVDSVNTLWRVETKGSGLHHAWNFDFVSAGLPTVSQFPKITKYVAPDTLLSMVSSFQCSSEIITVANYENVRFYYDVNNVLQDNGQTVGRIAAGSSLGPTRDGRQKPDIAASGQFIFAAAVLSMVPGLITNSPDAVAQGSMHVRGGGTSAASPIVAGLAGLYFQKNTFATNGELIRAITYCAYSDQFTGTQLPNCQYGFGKLDGKNTLLCGEDLVGLNSWEINRDVSANPNPFNDHVFLSFNDRVDNAVLTVYSPDGRIILYADKLSGKKYELNGNQFDSYHGLLIVTITTSEKQFHFKLLKE